MATAIFYTASKRENSTLAPSGAGVSLDVLIKDTTSFLNPTFRISYSSRPAFSMCSFEGRYYFITDIVSVHNNLWDVSCRVDVLATYKTQILASSQFVLYDETPNTEIIDQRIAPVTTKTRMQISEALDPSLISGGVGKVILSAVGEDSTDTYIINVSDVQDLLDGQSFTSFLGGNDVWGPIDASISGGFITDVMTSIMVLINGLGVAVKNMLGSLKVTDCIKSAIWIPWDISGDGTPRNIKLGLYRTDVVAAPVVNPLIWDSVDIDIPWQANDWRRNAPYHHIYVYIPFIGTVEVSPADVIGETRLTVIWSLNRLNGNMNVQLEAGNHILGVYSANTGVSLPIGASNITPGRTATTLLSGLSSAAAVGASGASPLGAAAALALGQINGIIPQPSSVGGGGGGAASKLDLFIRVTTVFHDTDVPPDSIAGSIGTPALARKLLSSLTGYVQCQNASVSIPGTDQERILINNYLNGGIFIE